MREKRENETEGKKNETRLEASPESQEYRIEIRIEVPEAEFSDYNLYLARIILDIRRCFPLI